MAGILRAFRAVLDASPHPGVQQARCLFRFQREADLANFLVTSDRDQVGGSSTAKAEYHPEGFARFSGSLSTTLPTTGGVVRSGFCLFRSRNPGRTLLRQQFLDLGMNNALEFELRGDGRPYIINIQTSSLHQEDLYQSFIYTRGGPNWQTVQNEQSLLSAERVRTIGFLLADKTEGPFQLDVKAVRAIRMEKELANMDAVPTRTREEEVKPASDSV